ncbi:MAG: response regulator [Bacteroidia bacterium]
MHRIKIAVVDDHKLFRDGMKALLKDYEDLHVVFEASNGKELFDELLKRKRPLDIIILDVEMPVMDGFEVLKKLKTCYPEIMPLVVTMHNEDHLIFELVELGAKGLLLKSADIEQVVDAIYNLKAGELYFNDEISQRVIKKLVKKEHIKRSPFNPLLSEREKMIILLICEQCTNKEIGDRLFISERTVETHKRNIFEKTKSKNSAGVVLYAVRTGLIE